MLTVGTDTYVSEADATAYIELMGLTPLSDPEPLLRRATVSMDRLYAGRYVGTKRSIDQPLQWPRNVLDNTDEFGNVRDFTNIPVEVANATVELAVLLDAGAAVFAQPVATLTKETIEVDVIKIHEERSGSVAPISPMYSVGLVLRPLLCNPASLRLVRG